MIESSSVQSPATSQLSSANDATPHYPSVFVAADRAAIKRQRQYLQLARAQLIALIGVAAASSSQQLTTLPSWAATFFGTLMVLLTISALFAGIWLRIERLDDKWFQCRALAENTKSLAWRYAMGVDASPDRDDRFMAAIRDLQARLPHSQTCISLEGLSGDWITPWMRQLSDCPLQTRIAELRARRILDQRNWYDAKARFNSRRESTWATALIALEALTVLVACIEMYRLLSDARTLLLGFSMVGVFASAAACVVAWMQLKRFSDLAQTYRIASDDLSHLDVQIQQLERAIQPGTPTEETVHRFRTLTDRVEHAISREHSLWLGRHVS